VLGKDIPMKRLQILRASDKYLKRDVGPRLWKILSEALGEKVSKKISDSPLQRRLGNNIYTS